MSVDEDGWMIYKGEWAAGTRQSDQESSLNNTNYGEFIVV